jgi:hypothetical protein
MMKCMAQLFADCSLSVIQRHVVDISISQIVATSRSTDSFGCINRFPQLNSDPRGVIRSMQINDDAVGRSVEETLRLLKV